MITSAQDAAHAANVSPSTLRTWVSRGWIRRHPDGYDLTEILAWLDRRDTRKVRQRAAA